MRYVLAVLLLLSSCVTEKASRGERIAAGATRIVYSAPLVISGASGIAASTLYGSLTVAALSGPGSEDARTAALLGLGVGVGVSAAFLAAGLPLLVTGGSMMAEAIDEEDRLTAAPSRASRRTREEWPDRAPKAVKRCTEGWDCPVEEEAQ